MVTTDFIALVMACAPAVDPGTAGALVAVESAFNPHAIGIVGGVLDRQPRQRSEALATARRLHADGWNYSVGLAQINAQNFQRLGLTIESAFEPCRNLAAMQSVLLDCFERADRRPVHTPQRSLRQALSCYYSGNFATGFDHGYVRRVVNASRTPASKPPSTFFHPKELP